MWMRHPLVAPSVHAHYPPHFKTLLPAVTAACVLVSWVHRHAHIQYDADSMHYQRPRAAMQHTREWFFMCWRWLCPAGCSEGRGWFKPNQTYKQ